jgi:hypothetical protein
MRIQQNNSEMWAWEWRLPHAGTLKRGSGNAETWEWQGGGDHQK